MPKLSTLKALLVPLHIGQQGWGDTVLGFVVWLPSVPYLIEGAHLMQPDLEALGTLTNNCSIITSCFSGKAAHALSIVIFQLVDKIPCPSYGPV